MEDASLRVLTAYLKISFGFNLIYQVILVGNWDQEPFLEFLPNVYP